MTSVDERTKVRGLSAHEAVTFGARSRTRLLWEIGVLSNLWVLGVAWLTILLQLSLHYIPLAQQIFGLKTLSLSEGLFILPVAFIPVSVVELKKLVQRSLSK